MFKPIKAPLSQAETFAKLEYYTSLEPTLVQRTFLVQSFIIIKTVQRFHYITIFSAISGTRRRNDGVILIEKWLRSLLLF